MARKGNPQCPWCAGEGGTSYMGRWSKCVCVNGTAEQRQAIRDMNSTGAARDYRKPLLDKEGNDGRP